jgi:hypothetical protein
VENPVEIASVLMDAVRNLTVRELGRIGTATLLQGAGIAVVLAGAAEARATVMHFTDGLAGC